MVFHVHNLPVVVEMSLRTECLKYSSHVSANPGETKREGRKTERGRERERARGGKRLGVTEGERRRTYMYIYTYIARMYTIYETYSIHVHVRVWYMYTCMYTST